METMIYRLTFVATFALIAFFTLKKSASVKSSDDFSVAGRSLTASGVASVIIGTLVGGVSTVGTVQTAYTSGIGAGIFTFGSGLSCLLLGLFFSRGLRQEGVVTVSEYLGRYFGPRFRLYTSAFNSLGMFIHIVGQFLASIAILKSVFSFATLPSMLITLVLLGFFVVSGGIAGAGVIGRIKFIMLYVIMLLGAGIALKNGGGPAAIIAALPADQDMLSLRDYGFKPAATDLFSMLVGVLSTQIYLQAIFSARDIREARNGALLSAVLIPPIGVLGIIIGLYLRAGFPELADNSAQALPFFLYHSFPPVIASLFSAGILLIVLGTGAGLTLGVTTNIYNDLFSRLAIRSQRITPLGQIRLITFAVLVAAFLLVFTGLDTAILKWSYMSMGLRGSAIFAGLVVLVFYKPACRSRAVRLALYSLPIIYVALSLHRP